MNTLSARLPRQAMQQHLWLALPLMIGIAALIVPTYWRLAHAAWQEEVYAHGPIVLMVVAWLVYRKRAAFFEADAATAPWAGGLCFVLGLLSYILGRSQDIILLETGAQIPLFAGLLLLLKGWRGVRRLWFPLGFLVFMVPLPGFLIDAITGPLKTQVSVVVAAVLYGAGLPISRSGVVLNVGYYQLLVADACSGLNSMYSLSAMGLLFLYLMQYKNRWQTGLVIASILPIAFAANVMRVMILVLITYYLGDGAGQEFHDIAAGVLYLLALGLLFGFDALIRPLFVSRQGRA